MLALKYVGAALAYVLYTGLGTLFIVLFETIVALKEDSEINLLRIFFIFTLSLYTGIGTIDTVMPGVFRRIPPLRENFCAQSACYFS